MSTDTLDAPVLSIDDQTADRLFRQARTAASFTSDEVGDEQIAAVYDLVKWGPTAMNIVPLRLLLVRSPQARERLAAHMAEGNRDRVLTAPLSIVLAADPGFHRHLPTLAPHRVEMVDVLEPAAEQREQMARTNALIQAGYFIVGLRAAGLAAGPMSGMDPAGIDQEFFAENGWKSFLVVNVGYPQGDGTRFPRAERLRAEQATLTV